uniref:Uncharacterized protein n=1 Tax=Anguilla anguilla TaxID=7936 RepID=A0A0E9PQ57_ANGAN
MLTFLSQVNACKNLYHSPCCIPIVALAFSHFFEVTLTGR